jgi:CTP-dependent riboflavin kinase
MRRRIQGVVFSDLGRASAFMALEWVQQALQKSLEFKPYPATLNLRPDSLKDKHLWRMIRNEFPGVPLFSVDGGYCDARLYLLSVHNPSGGNQVSRGAALVPEVAGYPEDKIEIVAPLRLKEAFSVEDGDRLVLEFDG